MDFQSILGIAAIILIVFLLFLDRKNLEIKGPLILRRTKRFNKFVETLSLKYSKIFNFLGLISIFFAIGAFAFFIYFSIKELIKPSLPSNQAPIQLVLPALPGICDSGFVFCVPPIYWLLIIPIVAVSHELMHAALSLSNRIKIKSMGYAFLLVLPAFFVEIDEKKLKKADKITKLKIYAAGSFGNFLVAAISILIVFSLQNLFYPSGIIFDVINNTPAYYANLSGIIIKINDIPIRTLEDLRNVSKEFRPNQTIIVETTEGIYKITLSENATMGIIVRGVELKGKNELIEKNKEIIFSIRDFFLWLFIISLGVGLFNLLPIKFLDGGLFFEELLKDIKGGKAIYTLLSVFTISLIILLILKPIINF